MDKILTVSIAAYNVEKTLEDAIRSCIVSDEWLEAMEIIVVDDGSRDKTLQIAREYEKQYPGVVKVITKENGGYGSTVNASLEIAQGKYYKLLDGDDSYETRQLERLLSHLENCESDMVITDYTEISAGTDKRVVSYKEYENGTEFEFQKLTDVESIVMHAVCYKTRLLKENNIRITEKCYYTDMEYLVYPMAHVYKITYYDCNVYMYNIGVEGQSVSKQGRMNHIDDCRRVYNNLCQYIQNCKADEVHLQALAQQLVRNAGFHMNSLLCFPYDKRKKDEIADMDRYLKKEYPKAYRNTKNKMTKILKINVEMIYPIAVLYYKYKK